MHISTKQYYSFQRIAIFTSEQVWQKYVRLLTQSQQSENAPFICCLIKASPSLTNRGSEGLRRYVQHELGSASIEFLTGEKKNGKLNSWKIIFSNGISS